MKFHSGRSNPTHEALAPMKHLRHYESLLGDLEDFLVEARRSSPWPAAAHCPTELGVAFMAEHIRKHGHRLIDELFQNHRNPNPEFVNMMIGCLTEADGDLLAAVSAWRLTQHVYRFDNDFALELVDTPLESELPCELLVRLPDYCVYVEAPGLLAPLSTPTAITSSGGWIDAGAQPIGFYAYLTPRRLSVPPALVFSDSELELVILRDFGPKLGYLRTVLPLLPGKPLSELGKIMSERYPVKLREGHHHEADFKPIGQILSLLLYLVDDEVDYNGREPPKPRDAISHSARPKHPTIWQVGFRVGAALRRAWAQQGEPQGGTHASPRAHVRRGHRHLYWTGPGRTIPRIKWVMPSWVGVGPIVPTVRLVKEGSK